MRNDCRAHHGFPRLSDRVSIRLATTALTLLLFLSVAAEAQTIHAGLVVVPSPGNVIRNCVQLVGPCNNGVTLLVGSSLPWTYQNFYNLGAAACSIAQVGCNFPQQRCFCQTNFWSFWILQPNGQWSSSGVGASSAQVSQGTVQGWVWGNGSTPPPPTSFSAICTVGTKKAAAAALGSVAEHPQFKEKKNKEPKRDRNEE